MFRTEHNAFKCMPNILKIGFFPLELKIMSKHNLILSKFNFLFKVIIDKYIQNIYTDKQ